MLSLFREYAPVSFRGFLWYLFSRWLWPWCLVILAGVFSYEAGVAVALAAMLYSFALFVLCWRSRSVWLPR